jgi:MFS family permease
VWPVLAAALLRTIRLDGVPPPSAVTRPSPFSRLIGAAASLWQVAALRTAAWTARGLRVPFRNPLLADATPREAYGRAYGRAYGFERMMDSLGAIGGPILALALAAPFSVRTAILLSISHRSR